MNVGVPIDRQDASAQNIPKKILIVEDEPQWQVMLSQMFRSMDKDVAIRCVRNAKSARQALDFDNEIDLVITDFNLDGKETGIDLWKSCQSAYPGLPFIVVSGVKEEKIQAEVRSSDYLAPIFVPKPLTMEHLRSALKMEPHARLSKTRPRPRMTSFLSLALVSLLAFPLMLNKETKDSQNPAAPPTRSVQNVGKATAVHLRTQAMRLQMGKKNMSMDTVNSVNLEEASKSNGK